MNHTGYGYLSIELCKNKIHKRRLIHRLVLLTFIGKCPKGYECNHKNGIKTDNRLENLEWVTSSENHIHAYKIGLKKGMKGEKHPAHKLTNSQVKKIRKLYNKTHLYQYQLGIMFNVTRKTIWKIITHESWKYI